MYVPPHFEEGRLDELHRIIGQYPLGAFEIKGANGVHVAHMVESFSVAIGHVVQGGLIAE